MKDNTVDLIWRMIVIIFLAFCVHSCNSRKTKVDNYLTKPMVLCDGECK